jgi:RHS repeat-associated protein
MMVKLQRQIRQAVRKVYEGEETDETVEKPFKFNGQWHDAEIDQHYLRTRYYILKGSKVTRGNP